MQSEGSCSAWQRERVLAAPCFMARTPRIWLFLEGDAKRNNGFDVTQRTQMKECACLLLSSWFPISPLRELTLTDSASITRQPHQQLLATTPRLIPNQCCVVFCQAPKWQEEANSLGSCLVSLADCSGNAVWPSEGSGPPRVSNWPVLGDRTELASP